MKASPDVIGFILAGGTSRRMGGSPKGLLPIKGEPMLAHVIRRFERQVDALYLNSNLPLDAFADFDMEVVADLVGASDGPLAGLITALRTTGTHHPDVSWVATIPWDCPFLPLDLVERLAAHVEPGGGAFAKSGSQRHPLAALWSVDLLPQLEAAFAEGMRSATAWAEDIGVKEVAFPAEPADPFFNVNSREDLAEAERRIRSGEE